MTLRLSMVGSGAIARVHAGIFGREGVGFETVIGRVAEDTAAFAAEFGFTRSGIDWGLLEGDASEAVVITSPSDLHYAHVKRALLAGKHVLAEIPLAMSLAEGRELAELAQRQGKCLMVAHSRRFIAAMAALRARVVGGSLRVHHLVARWGIPRRQNVGWTGRPRSWKDSLLWHHGCHMVDFALWFLQATEVEVLAQVSRPDRRSGIPMDIDILLRTPTDQMVALSLSFNPHMRFEEYLVVGEEETLRFDQGRFYGPTGPREDLERDAATYREASWEAQDREFLASLRERRPPAVGGPDVLPTLAVLQRIQDQFVNRAAM
jgi:2-hydroxy-4-carboxymuconate semialdehyde hemiacetal dehydrogenase